MIKAKKIAASVAICASMIVSALPMTAFAAAAAPTYTVTINQTAEKHTYDAYQIFKADLAEDGSFTNIQWGTGVSVTEGAGIKSDFAAALEVIDKNFDGKTTADDIAAVLDGFTNNDEKTQQFANTVVKYLSTVKATSAYSGNKQIISDLSAGYYLVKDAGTVTGEDAYTKYALIAVDGKNDVINPKTDYPTLMKKVKENVKDVDPQLDATAYPNSDDYNDVADYDIGEEIPFALYSKVPDLTNFKKYVMVFEDKMDKGLTLDETSITVTVGTKKLTKDTDYKVSVTTGDECTFHVTINDLKSVAAEKGDQIRVDFTAKLNENAEIGLPGNVNEAWLKFTNNPNFDSGYDSDSSGDNTPDGETVHDKVIIFTYELDVNKVDAADHSTKLKDAEFKLSNGKNQYAKVTNDIFEGWVDEGEATTLKSDTNGKFKVIGLDDGTYYLKETKAPEGYNLVTDPIEITVKATTVNDQSWEGKEADDALTKLEVTVDKNTVVEDTDAGSVSVTVENSKGKTLPSTGALGTKIFFIGGGSVAVIAAVLLIVKRRMHNSEK